MDNKIKNIAENKGDSSEELLPIVETPTEKSEVQATVQGEKKLRPKTKPSEVVMIPAK